MDQTFGKHFQTRPFHLLEQASSLRWHLAGRTFGDPADRELLEYRAGAHLLLQIETAYPLLRALIEHIHASALLCVSEEMAIERGVPTDIIQKIRGDLADHDREIGTLHRRLESSAIHQVLTAYAELIELAAPIEPEHPTKSRPNGRTDTLADG